MLYNLVHYQIVIRMYYEIQRKLNQQQYHSIHPIKITKHPKSQKSPKIRHKRNFH